MDDAQMANVVEQVRALVEARYVFPEIAAEVSRVLATRLAEGHYPTEAQALAAAITEDLQSVNSDKHLRLVYHGSPLPPAAPGDDAEEYAAMARWADRTCGGVASARRLVGNIGYLDLQPVLFPTVVSGEIIAAAMTVLASTEALIVDLRHCLGGELNMAAYLISYLWDHEPVQLTGLQERGHNGITQFWTQPYVPGRRFGKTKPVYVLASASTFSGGEQLSYDLQRIGRAVIVGERTRGGAHAREGFPVHPHLEATISVAMAVNPASGDNWEGVGVAPDIEVPAADAFPAAHRLALERVANENGPSAAEARDALAAELAPPTWIRQAGPEHGTEK